MQIHTSVLLKFSIRSHKWYCSVSRSAEQKLLKARGPRLGRRNSKRQFFFPEVFSACVVRSKRCISCVNTNAM